MQRAPTYQPPTDDTDEPTSHVPPNHAPGASGAGSVPPAVASFRAEYRERFVSPRYRGPLHLLFTFGLGTAVFVYSLARLEQLRAVELLAVPLTFLYTNLAEYWGHRGPMHHLRRGLRAVYERHTRQHHRFFTNDCMALEGWRDLYAVMFPPVLMTFFIAAFALPMGLAISALTTANVAWLFVATSIGYFLNYEFLHLAYHLPDGSRIRRWRWIRRLEGLHRTHHDPRVMASCNFNITYPICDWLFGTLRSAGAGRSVRSARAGRSD